MSFGNSMIYPFPAVQYIPLPVITISRGSLGRTETGNTAPLLVAERDLRQWRKILQRDYDLEIPETFPDDSFPLLALNCNVDEVKYRGYFVTMAGKASKDYYQLFWIPKRYFYKKKLYFELYDRESAKRLARYSSFVNI